MALTKAVIVNLDAAPGTPPVPVMFNPPKYTLSKTNHFAEIKVQGLSTSRLQFVNGNAQSLSLELFFDTTESGRDVRMYVAAITSLTEPARGKSKPPHLLLLWGSLAFSCYLISVREDYEQFDSQGVPLRARLTAEFKGQDRVSKTMAAMPMAAVELAASYVVKRGDTLQAVAASAYKDPAQWRTIAVANGVDDPRRLNIGQNLRLPRAR